MYFNSLVGKNQYKKIYKIAKKYKDNQKKEEKKRVTALILKPT